MMERVMLLERYCDQTDSILQHVNTRPELDQIIVDVVDALSLAVTGMIGVEEGFKTIPEKAVKDSRGIMMEMVYADPGK